MNRLFLKLREKGLLGTLSSILKLLSIWCITPIRYILPITHNRLRKLIWGYGQQLDALLSKNVETILESSNGATSPVFIDCGVNEGEVISRYQSQLKNFTFVGFEIQRELVNYVRRRFPRLVIHEAAVSTSNTHLTMRTTKAYGPNYRGGSSTIPNKVSDGNVQEEKTVLGIDFILYLKECRDLGHDYVVVKMDIEGSEYPIIQKLHDVYLETHECLIDYLLIEFHPKVLDESKPHDAFVKMLGDMPVTVSEWL